MKRYGKNIKEIRQYELNSMKESTATKEYVPLSASNEMYWFAYVDLKTRGAVTTYGEMVAYADLANLDRTQLLCKVQIIEDIFNDNDSGTGSIDTGGGSKESPQ